jgi:septation ring formation regulator EzrA
MVQQREMELTQLRQQNTVNQINGQAQQYMNQLIGQGWDEAHARESATQYAQNLYSTNQRQESQRIANDQAKVARAFELSYQYGAPMEMLKAYDNPVAMEQAAKMYKETTGRIQGLEQQLRQQNKAPVQQFDSNRMTASGSPASLKLRYATDPNFEPSNEQLARIMAG